VFNGCQLKGWPLCGVMPLTPTGYRDLRMTLPASLDFSSISPTACAAPCCHRDRTSSLVLQESRYRSCRDSSSQERIVSKLRLPSRLARACKTLSSGRLCLRINACSMARQTGHYCPCLSLCQQAPSISCSCRNPCRLLWPRYCAWRCLRRST
jgi:hypothetical protein